MKPILEIKSISKKFRIRHENHSYLSLRDSLTSLFKPDRSSSEEFYALNNVSFDVFQGECIGIIGKNGAGKSTLLKILSKITPPSSGKITSRGRIASLLEVGTGFHSELSGRENIFLNGSILGMKRKEIESKFDEIVDFSGVENFLDTPLKHYSSGMQLRLAFAVAAFLEPEILVIDEVLAVGDAEFQKKCMGKMEDVSKSGRTILLVSHQMGTIAQLCKKTIIIEKGAVIFNDETNKAIDKYLSDHQYKGASWACDSSSARKKIYFRNINLINDKKELTDVLGFNESINISLKIIYNERQPNLKISVTMLDKFQSRIFTSVELLDNHILSDGNEYSLTLKIPGNIIAPNYYTFRYALYDDNGNVFDLLESETKVRIMDTGTEMAKYEGVDYGFLILKCEWT